MNRLLFLLLLATSPLRSQIATYPFPVGGSGGCVSPDTTRNVVWYGVESPASICKTKLDGTQNTCVPAPSNVSVGGCTYSASDDKVYVILQNVGGTTDQIVQFDPISATFTATWNIPEGVAGTAGIIAYNDALYCMETSANKVCKVSLLGVFSSSIVVGTFPHGPSIGPNGKLRFVLFNGNQIGQIDTSDAYTFVTLPQATSHPGTTTPCTLQGTPGICFTINTPGGSNAIGQMGFMPDNNQTQGAITVINIPTGVPNVWGSATGADGNVYASERGTNKILIWTMANNQINDEWLLPNGGQSPNKLCALLGYIAFTEHITTHIDITPVRVLPSASRSGLFARVGGFLHTGQL